MEQKRGTFSSGLGFVLAAAGSAVGLGNIWRFPYLAAKYGGGIFLLVYIILVCTFGYALMVAENAIGRKSGKSSLNAFGSLNKKWGFLGIIATLIPCIILPYYDVIGGWIIQYFAVYFGGLVTKLAPHGYDPDKLVESIWKGTKAMIKNNGEKNNEEVVVENENVEENVIVDEKVGE